MNLSISDNSHMESLNITGSTPLDRYGRYVAAILCSVDWGFFLSPLRPPVNRDLCYSLAFIHSFGTAGGSWCSHTMESLLGNEFI